MRLLRLENEDELSFAEFVRENPPYAILSHTWGEDEVSYRDLCDLHTGRAPDRAKDRQGYAKILFCAQQAKRDRLDYFWVDTCCIDKSSSAELQEAINSMFRWYQDAARCYVYLSDLSIDMFNLNKQSFQRCRWFSRTWTLQELLAPTSVEFFSWEGERIGDKRSMVKEIHRVTGIPVSALEGAPLSGFAVNERLLWAKGRHATRVEDEAYSLMGILEVHMPMLYGEGSNAYDRLLSEVRKMYKDPSHPALERSVDPPLGSPNRVEDPELNFTKSHFGAIPSGVDPLLVVSKRVDDLMLDLEVPDTGISTYERSAVLDSDSDSESEVASIFSYGAMSTSSASTASLNSVQSVGIREVSQALLSKEDLKAIYALVVTNIDRRKAHSHIRGFLKEYGLDLVKEASNRTLELQAANFIRDLAGRIADEIAWKIAGFEEETRSPKSSSDKNNLETWLSSLRLPGSGAEEEPNSPRTGANVEELFENENSDDELSDDLIFPNIDKVKDFLLTSEAIQVHVSAMRKWMKMDSVEQGDMEGPVEDLPDRIALNATTKSTSQTPDAQKTPQVLEETEPFSQQDTAQESRPNYRSIQSNHLVDLISGILEFDLFTPRIRPGYRRLRWRCVSLNASIPICRELTETC
ncbi:uncharacterized protein N0V89_011919 [Didymosphaeria variabile]|uniref:Heterokaryon incompatibility domain-containing protein n=1 Tax=Didymosphaeria variabile TaxID=1932322 RepID=A0A9W9C674_9PLEO|nr:uncharacterized protein N0V89_011919 [Didymosphaeria variabile]KAJ4345784.1 hypothetical protein N0V89_011919 [Didymosphaeria variabile]